MGLVEQHHALNRPQDPVCSVCIANYNGVGLLDECLTSILMQQGDISTEIIVHDDASTDGSVALLRERYPQVEVLAAAENVGFCVSNNRMVEQARGEYVLLLNNDAALHLDAIATLLAAARAQAGPVILTLPQYDWTTNALVDRGCMLDLFYNPVPNLDPARREVSMSIGACMFLPRSLWNDLGGFPDWIESIGEDMYLCCLARLRGVAVMALPGSGFRHRLGASFGGARIVRSRLSTTLRRRRLSERNKTFVMFLCTPGAVMWVLLGTHLVSLLLEGIVVSIVRFDMRIFTKVYANVLRSLLREKKRLLPLRRHIQGRRKISMSTYFATFTRLPYKLVLLLRFGIPKVSK
jgi:GT2 family glycosyltransferase